MSEKYKLTNEEINKAVLHSPYALADSPYKKGLGAAQIKKFFYDFIVYLANSINSHLGEVGTSFDTVDTRLEELYTRVNELHETDLVLNNYFSNEISKRLNEHNKNDVAHKDLRELIDSAIAIATGRTKVYVKTDFYSMVRDMGLNGDDFNEGDIIVITEKNVPDFIVIGKGEKSPEAVKISVEEIEAGTLEIAPAVGERYYIQGSAIEIIAIENGIDTSLLVTKEEFLELERSKQDKLTFDTYPIKDSENPITSGGVEKGLQDLAQAQNKYLTDTLKQFEGYMDEKHASKEEVENLQDEIQSLGGGSNQKEYELIKTFTLPQAENSFDILTEAEGFELTDFYVKVTGSITSDTNASGKVSVSVNNGNILFGQASVALLKHQEMRKWAIDYKTYGQDLGGYASYPNTALGSSVSFPNSNLYSWLGVVIPPNLTKSATYKYNSIKSITIACSISGETFREDSIFEIWGVRK